MILKFKKYELYNIVSPIHSIGFSLGLKEQPFYHAKSAHDECGKSYRFSKMNYSFKLCG